MLNCKGKEKEQKNEGEAPDGIRSETEEQENRN